MHSATFILMSSLSLLQDFVFRPASQSSKAWNFETSGRNRRNLSLGFWPFSSISFLKPLISFNSIMKFGGKDIACKHVLWISERGIHTAAVVPLAPHRERERETQTERQRGEAGKRPGERKWKKERWNRTPPRSKLEATIHSSHTTFPASEKAVTSRQAPIVLDQSMLHDKGTRTSESVSNMCFKYVSSRPKSSFEECNYTVQYQSCSLHIRMTRHLWVKLLNSSFTIWIILNPIKSLLTIWDIRTRTTKDITCLAVFIMNSDAPSVQKSRSGALAGSHPRVFPPQTYYWPGKDAAEQRQKEKRSCKCQR